MTGKSTLLPINLAVPELINDLMCGLCGPVGDNKAVTDSPESFLDLTYMGTVVGIEEFTDSAFAQPQAAGERSFCDTLPAHCRIEG